MQRRGGRFEGFMNGFAMVAGPARDGPDSEWLDDMVKKLKTALEAQLKAIGDAGAADDARARASDARTLASLERTLEKLALLERERAAVREKKVAGHGKGARAALEHRLDKRLAGLAKDGPARKP
jgi:hypothetical protein